MRFLPRLTYANVVATIAMFIALGGISYAATNLAKNSVGTKQIKKNAVTKAKIKKNSVTKAKIKNKSITKSKIDPKLFDALKGKDASKLTVYNSDGSVLGILAGTMYSGLPIFQVIIDDGLYLYYPSGQVLPIGGFNPVFKDNTCAGTAYVESSLESYDEFFSKLAGGPTRVIFRTTSGASLGPISAWQFTTTHETVAALNIWKLNTTTGACEPGGTSTGELIALDPVTPPPDGIGPLTIS